MAPVRVISQYWPPSRSSVATYHPVVAANIAAIVVLGGGCYQVALIVHTSHRGAKVHGTLR